MIKQIIESVKRKSYYEITLKELIEFAGGKDKIKRLNKDNDAAYKFLNTKHDELMEKLADEGYEENGEVSTEEISDWVDSNFRS